MMEQYVAKCMFSSLSAWVHRATDDFYLLMKADAFGPMSAYIVIDSLIRPIKQLNVY